MGTLDSARNLERTTMQLCDRLSGCPIDNTGTSLVYRKHVYLCNVDMRRAGGRPNNLLGNVLRYHYEGANEHQAAG